MPGNLVHFEIRAGDVARAQQFWGSLFGWRFSDWEGPVRYSLVDTGGTPAGGLYESETAERGLVAYFDVDDIEPALERVRELGGEVLQDKSAIPGIGWYANCRDTEGNPFSLFQSDEGAHGPGESA